MAHKRIPSFWNYSNPKTAATKLTEWFNNNGHTATIKFSPSGVPLVSMNDYEWTMDYSYSPENDSPFGWLTEPWDEYSLIFTKELETA